MSALLPGHSQLSYGVPGGRCIGHEDRGTRGREGLGALRVVLGLRERRLAVALNRSVVPRSTYDRVALAAGDRIEILEAVGGG